MSNISNPGHTGLMPIRVLQHNLVNAFENMNPDFLELTNKIVTEKGLDPGISYSFEPRAVRSPFVAFRKIFVEESFLSYVWCVCYSLTVLHEEITVKRSKNDYFHSRTEVINMELTRDAFRLWEYAISLISVYSTWDAQLPNPESIKDGQQELTWKVNGLYIVAMTYVLSHEFAHIEFEHDTQPNLGNFQNAMLEKQADGRAIELVLAGLNTENSSTVKIGIVMGFCSLLFFSSILRGEKYPDTDERIEAVIKALKIEDPQDAVWGIVTLAYKLWDQYYNIGLIWHQNLDSYRDLYYSIKKQIEDKKKRS